jgi:hypothetical protein
MSRLEQARNQEISSVRLSSWDADDQNDVTEALCEFLMDQTHHSLEEVTLQNCKGNLEGLVGAILQSSPQRLTIRYDKQHHSVPRSIADGLVQDAANSKVQHLGLRGMTLTPSVMESLRIALPQIVGLESISVKGNFLLQELDKKEVSILGRKEPDDVLDGLVELLQELPKLKCLDLENCHIPDGYLADLLAVTPISLTTLKLRGNQCQEESLLALFDWMTRPDCQLKHLDLTWQRLRGSKRNYSAFSNLALLAKALSLNASLDTLLLSENRILDKDMELLTNALIHNSTLQTLELKDCRIADLGFQALARGLANLHLRRLDLNGHQRVNDISKLKPLFFKPLTNNAYLYDLVLPHTDSKSLSWLLEWNRAGRRVLIEPSFQTNLWPVLLERADRIGRQASERQPDRHAASAIYHLLREKGFACIPSSNPPTPTKEEETSRQKETPTQEVRKHSRVLSSSSPDGIELEIDENLPQKTKGGHQKSKGENESLISWLFGERGPLISVNAIL